MATITWTAKDAAGNISNATQTVDEVDTTAPKINPPKDIKVEATSLTDNAVSLGNATATDVEQVAISNNSHQKSQVERKRVEFTGSHAIEKKTNEQMMLENHTHLEWPQLHGLQRMQQETSPTQLRQLMW